MSATGRCGLIRHASFAPLRHFATNRRESCGLDNYDKYAYSTAFQEDDMFGPITLPFGAKMLFNTVTLKPGV